jgi:hypothetical protein
MYQRCLFFYEANNKKYVLISLESGIKIRPYWIKAYFVITTDIKNEMVLTEAAWFLMWPTIRNMF